MNIYFAARRGTLTRSGDTIRINNALVEEVFASDTDSGYMIISYEEPNEDGTYSVELIRVNVGQGTTIIDSLGRTRNFRDLRKGMWVDVLLSADVAAGPLPQTNAFVIIIQIRMPASRNVTTARIIGINPDERSFYTGEENNPESQRKFQVVDGTSIQDSSGRPVDFPDLAQGQMVRITHSNFPMPGLPQETTAFQVLVL